MTYREDIVQYQPHAPGQVQGCW